MGTTDSGAKDKYIIVIGLEVHAQLLTNSKIYNTDSASYGGNPNTHLGVITLAHPGTLPKLNKRAVEHAIRMGLACNSEIAAYQIFDRKNYFYPDLPKGYQLTQDRTPICKGGRVTIITKAGEEKHIQLNRIHLEEDAGKSIHMDGGTDSQVDFNRAGVALIEIVTEPVLRSSEEAYLFFSEIRKLVRYLDVCDGNMEEGSLRCDANVSVMLKDASEYGKKVEIKNMNSLRHVQRAIDFEAVRQIELLERGEKIISETRTFDATDGKTYGMRTKEELNDYRYFPDPDLSPLVIPDSWLNKIRQSMPALPNELKQKFIDVYKLPEYDARVLTDSKEIAGYFEDICKGTKNYKAASNWVMGPVKSYLNESGGEEEGKFPLPAETLVQLLTLVEEGKVSFAVASQKLFPALVGSSTAPLALAQQMNLIQESDSNLIGSIIDEVLSQFPEKVEEYRNGKKGIMSMFMGEVMKRSKGKADPKVTTDLLNKKLSNQ